MEQGFTTKQQLAETASNALASHVEPLKHHTSLMRLDRAYERAKELVADRTGATAYDPLAILEPARADMRR